MKAGELESAVGELEKLSGLPADVAVDWLKDAKTRLTADEVTTADKREPTISSSTKPCVTLEGCDAPTIHKNPHQNGPTKFHCEIRPLCNSLSAPLLLALSIVRPGYEQPFCTKLQALRVIRCHASLLNAERLRSLDGQA